MNTPYKQLIEDWLEADRAHDGFLFARIMNFIFKRLPERKKYLYVVIREHVPLKRLSEILSTDWVNSAFIESDKIIALATDKWQWEKERIEFT